MHCLCTRNCFAALHIFFSQLLMESLCWQHRNQALLKIADQLSVCLFVCSGISTVYLWWWRAQSLWGWKAFSSSCWSLAPSMLGTLMMLKLGSDLLIPKYQLSRLLSCGLYWERLFSDHETFNVCLTTEKLIMDTEGGTCPVCWCFYGIRVTINDTSKIKKQVKTVLNYSTLMIYSLQTWFWFVKSLMYLGGEGYWAQKEVIFHFAFHSRIYIPELKYYKEISICSVVTLFFFLTDKSLFVVLRVYFLHWKTF